MARKTAKNAVIKGLPDDKESLVVQKSNPLYSLWKSPLTLAEFKIMDTYLSRINSRDPSKRVVVFEKGEIEKLLGVTKINLPELKERLSHLMTVVEVKDGTIKKGFKLVTLFSEAIAEQDEAGLWKVKLEASDKAFKYFFNIEQLGYIRYKLRCVVSLGSRYSYILFNYLEKNRFRKAWDIDLDELKEMLGCQDEETYKQYKFFNQKILSRCYEELNEKTECHFSYQPIRKGRKVTAIHFEVETLPNFEEEENPDQITIDQWLDSMEESPEAVQAPLWHEAIAAWKLEPEVLEEIGSVLVTVPDDKLPHPDGVGDNVDIRRFHYIDRKVKEINRRDKSKPIRNKAAYLLKIMRKDAGTED